MTDLQPQAGMHRLLGWQTVTITRQGQKFPPSSGFTGKTGSTESQMTQAGYNYAIRLPKGVIALDVDNGYECKTEKRIKHGSDTLERLVEKFGPLPATWRLGSRLDTGSGQLFFRIPANVEMVGEVPAGFGHDGKHSDIEILQFHHRYSVGPGSTVSDEDGERTYVVVSPEGELVDTLPEAGLLPELPAAWLAALRDGADLPVRVNTYSAVEASDNPFEDEKPNGPRRMSRTQASGAFKAARQEYLDSCTPGYNKAAFKYLCISKAYWLALGNELDEWEEEARELILEHPYFETGEWPRLNKQDKARIADVEAKGDIVWELTDELDPSDFTVHVITDSWDCGGTTAQPLVPTRAWLKKTNFRLKYWRENFYRYSNGQYKLFEDGELRAILQRDFDKAYYMKRKKDEIIPVQTPFMPNRVKLNEIIATLESECYRETHWAPDSKVSFENGYLDPRTGEMSEHSPSVFNLHKIAGAYDPDAECPEWMKFIASSLPEQDQQDLLQEMMGYLLSGRQDLQKIFGLWGRPRAGKSVIMRVIKTIIGSRAVANPSLSGLCGGFGLASCADASIIEIGEARFNRENRGASDLLLKISGQDQVEVNVKNKGQYNAVLPGRIVMVSNEQPNILEDSGAFSGRFIHLRFDISFQGREDTELPDRLAKEIPGIAAWAMKGLARLNAQKGKFTASEKHKASDRSLQTHANHLLFWYNEQVKTVEGETVTAEVLYRHYNAWADENDIDVTSRTNQNRMGRFLTSMGVTRTRVQIDGQQVRVWANIKVS